LVNIFVNRFYIFLPGNPQELCEKYWVFLHAKHEHILQYIAHCKHNRSLKKHEEWDL